ncbi:MAG: (2Fe-2S)-binding protein [Campylobacterales bacterium]|nr:(2Fe-2S)-binding protein [Campylobacterales bacterium]
MIDLKTEVCICNSVTFEELIKHIKENNIMTMQELLENSVCPVGDKCESCHDEGYNNDGLNLPLALSLAKKS